MTDQEQIDALKAQVNCLYEVLDKSRLLSKAKTAPEMRRIEQEIRELLSRTSEQCLAEVKAKAIEDMLIEFNKTNLLGTSLTNIISDYMAQIREQAK